MRKRRAEKGMDRGSALIAVIAILGVIAAVATGFATSMRVEDGAASGHLAGIDAELAAEAGIQAAAARLLMQSPQDAPAEEAGADEETGRFAFEGVLRSREAHPGAAGLEYRVEVRRCGADIEGLYPDEGAGGKLYWIESTGSVVARSGFAGRGRAHRAVVECTMSALFEPSSGRLVPVVGR